MATITITDNQVRLYHKKVGDTKNLTRTGTSPLTITSLIDEGRTFARVIIPVFNFDDMDQAVTQLCLGTLFHVITKTIGLSSGILFGSFLSIVRCLSGTMYEDIKDTLPTVGFISIVEPTFDEFATMTELTPEDILDLVVNREELGIITGIYLNLIGKSFTTANHKPWFDKRIEAYCNALGNSLSANKLKQLIPRMDTCETIKGTICRSFDFRRQLFLAMEKKAGDIEDAVVSQSFSITMNLLRGVDMAMVRLCLDVLGNCNEFTATWNEVARHNAVLNMAFEQLNQFKDQREYDYCKILFRSDQVSAFHRHHYDNLIAIALAVLIHYGDESLRNFQYARYQKSQTVVLFEKALALAKSWGSCNTEATRRARCILSVDDDGNKEYLDLLRSNNENTIAQQHDGIIVPAY
ncbi:ORF1 [Sanxia water strider virus 4]|uniref:ORF1 n=1 Tax=Sanxia water strider virus 4 TaxID=1608063 RepID=A0A0B5KTE4_9MONO|nr:ORF1 [Sanxia water strider virus 4]AJG39112.1 ORF1 [Sanxia water strider virus 4]